MVKVIGIGYLILAGTGATMIGYSANQQKGELDLDFLFKTSRWEQVHSVETKEYEVEKVTSSAGVRGDEAEHEILEYLYYIVNTKTGQNSLETGKPIHILVK